MQIFSGLQNTEYSSVLLEEGRKWQKKPKKNKKGFAELLWRLKWPEKQNCAFQSICKRLRTQQCLVALLWGAKNRKVCFRNQNGPVRVLKMQKEKFLGSASVQRQRPEIQLDSTLKLQGKIQGRLLEDFMAFFSLDFYPKGPQTCNYQLSIPARSPGLLLFPKKIWFLAFNTTTTACLYV